MGRILKEVPIVPPVIGEDPPDACPDGGGERHPTRCREGLVGARDSHKPPAEAGGVTRGDQASCLVFADVFAAKQRESIQVYISSSKESADAGIVTLFWNRRAHVLR